MTDERDPRGDRRPHRADREPGHRPVRHLHYSRDGNRSLTGLSDRPLVTPYEIRDGRRIETTLLGDQISVALFSVDGRILGAREDEAGSSTGRSSPSSQTANREDGSGHGEHAWTCS